MIAVNADMSPGAGLVLCIFLTYTDSLQSLGIEPVPFAREFETFSATLSRPFWLDCIGLGAYNCNVCFLVHEGIRLDYMPSLHFFWINSNLFKTETLSLYNLFTVFY